MPQQASKSLYFAAKNGSCLQSTDIITTKKEVMAAAVAKNKNQEQNENKTKQNRIILITETNYSIFDEAIFTSTSIRSIVVETICVFITRVSILCTFVDVWNTTQNKSPFLLFFCCTTYDDIRITHKLD